jgi:hypothetical protein
MAKKKTSGKRKSKTSSNDATATDKHRGKRKGEHSASMMIIMPLGDHEDLIVPFLMEFLAVPTLVSLGSSTNKKNQEHLSEQVARRKSRFKAIQNKISNELLSPDILMPSREMVHQALRLRQEPCRLIGSGLGRVDHELFAEERELLEAHRTYDISEHLLMLPPAFYLSKNRIWEKPAKAGNDCHASFRRADRACQGWTTVVSARR